MTAKPCCPESPLLVIAAVLAIGSALMMLCAVMV